MYQISKKSSFLIEHKESMRALMDLEDNVADALITDCPYASGGLQTATRRGSTTTKYIKHTKRYPNWNAGDQRDQRTWYFWCTMWMTEALRVVRDGGIIATFSDWRQTPAMSNALQVAGWVWRGTGVWHKTGGGARSTRGRFCNQSEFWLWGSRGDMDPDRYVLARDGGNALSGHFELNPNGYKLHSTGKPIPLMQHICRVVEPGGLIVDPFNGSGSTGIAAATLGYDYLGFESDVEYVNLTRDRYDHVCATGEDLPIKDSVRQTTKE